MLFGITLVTFFLLRLIPGDPALAILGSSYTHTRAVAIDNTLGLNKPIWSQYGLFMGRLFHGNLGFSFFYDEPATTVIAQHIRADAVPDRLQRGARRADLASRSASSPACAAAASSTSRPGSSSRSASRCRRSGSASS